MTADQWASAILMLLGLPVALVFGALGWVVPRRNDARRFTYRYFAFAGLFLTQVAQITPWDGWWSVLAIVLGLFCTDRVSHWWRKAEAAREWERAYARSRGGAQ